MGTGALADFEDTLGLARALLALEMAYADPPPTPDQATVAALRGGAAVLMVAALERYLRALFGEILDQLATEPPPVQFRHLPEQLRHNSVWNSLRAAMAGPKHAPKGSMADRFPAVLSAAGRVVAGRIDPAALSDTGGNPSSDTMKRMFAHIGITDIFKAVRADFDSQWGKAEVATFVADKLDEVVRTRHRVAHTADALAISRADLGVSMRFLETLANTVDIQSTRYVNSVLRAGARAAKAEATAAGA